MDLRRARTWEWLAGAFGLALAVSPVLDWYGCRAGAANPGCDGGALTGWEALAVTDVVLVIAGLTGVAALVLTVIQRTPAFPLAVTTLGILVALVAALLAIVALAVGPGGAGGGGAAASRLVGVWLGAGAAVGLVVSLLAAMRDERIPDAAPGMEGAAPEPRTLTLSSSSAAGGRGGEPADGRGAA